MLIRVLKKVYWKLLMMWLSETNKILIFKARFLDFR